MVGSDAVLRAREAFARREWREAHAAFAIASRDDPLELSDLEQYAVAAYLFGRGTESREIFAQGYREALGADQRPRAAWFAFWIGHGLMFSGEEGQASAWFGRGRAALDEHPGDCVERGYFLVARGIPTLFSGAPAESEGIFVSALEYGRRFNDATLLAVAGHGYGRSLIAQGRIAEGMAALDEVMLAATGGEVSPIVVGDAYCGVLEACHDVFDIRRAREWTAALTNWCDTQPDLVPYRGPCLVHRVELLRLQGDWSRALAEARRACEWLSEPLSPEGPGDAFYEMGELHRLRGDYDAAEDAYRQASRAGRQPEPGIALLWAARGQMKAASTAIERCLDENGANRTACIDLLRAQVEILLLHNEVEGARAAALELAARSRTIDAPLLAAAAERALGWVLVAEGRARESLEHLRRAWMAWQQLDAPFEAARERVQIGIALRAIGDQESATMEFDAARRVFQELGAAPALAALDQLSPPLARGGRDRLTAREEEVLRLVAAGHTNRQIATQLVISEHTVARHIQNMLGKLGFSSRARLAAFAVERRAGGDAGGQN